ncbi:uncharacterized protein [Battus philenor]|uniref:uncharacterized protein n=1 Tax=Battus philenor TaxID=42288 RepID=UPI0035D0EBE8
MQCFICVVYLITSCTAVPSKYRELVAAEEISTSSSSNDLQVTAFVKNGGESLTLEKHTTVSPQISENQSESSVNEAEGDITTRKPIQPVYSAVKPELFKHAMVMEMLGMSQIGDSERLTVINPTVIVNFRGTVLNRESDLQLGQRKKDKRKPGGRPAEISGFDDE